MICGRIERHFAFGKSHILGLAALLLLAVPAQALAWGSLTHMALIMEAQDKTGLPVPENLMGAYLAGSTEPDISALTPSGNAVTSDYHVYHDAAFADAMRAVAARKTGRERAVLLARAEGFAAHLTGDSVAHVASGYPQTKKAYETAAGNSKANHSTVEFMVDTMSYVKNRAKFDKYKPEYIDAATLSEIRAEYAKMKGVTIETDPKKLNVEILKHRAVVTTDVTVAKYLMEKKPALVKEMGEFTSEWRSGTNGAGGVSPSVDKLVSRLQNAEKIDYKKGDDKRKLGEKIAGAASLVVKRAEEAGLGATEKLVFKVSGIGFVRENIMELANKKVQGSNGVLARFLMNVTMDRDVTLREALYEAEKPALEPGDAEGALKLKRTGVEILARKTESARIAYENRPWWKFWLAVTKADKKKYESLKAEYEAGAAELKALEESRRPAVSAPAFAPFAPAALPPDGKSLTVIAAEERLRAAYKSYIDAGTPASGPEFEAYTRAAEDYKNARNAK